jgi:hypothetical protein
MNVRKCRSQSDLEAAYAVIHELRPRLCYQDYISIMEEAKKRYDYELIAIFVDSKCIAAMGDRTLFDFVHGKQGPLPIKKNLWKQKATARPSEVLGILFS